MPFLECQFPEGCDEGVEIMDVLHEGEGRKIYDRFCSISGPNVAKLKSINKAWVQIGYFLPLVVPPILHL